MTDRTNDQNATKIVYVNHGQPLKTGLFAFSAALAGTAVGFVAALAVAMPVVSRDLAAQAKVLDQHLADATTDSGSSAAACIPSGGSGQVLGESVTGQSEQMPAGGRGGGQQPAQSQENNQSGNSSNPNNKTFVNKLVAGSLVRTAAAISNTGPYSTNNISSENTVNTSVNTSTNVKVEASTGQYSSSGDTSVKDNTYGGSATSGDANNTANSSFDIQVAN